MARDVSHLLCTSGSVGAPIGIEFLNYEYIANLHKENKLAKEIANLYSTPIDLVEQLAQDPDHGGRRTVSSYIETMVALELEKDGILGITVGRGPSRTDLIDGWKRKWDVKAPPIVPEVNFNFESAISSIRRKFNEFPNKDIGILLCVSFLNPKVYFDLQEILVNRISPDEIFRVRQVTISAFLECHKEECINQT